MLVRRYHRLQTLSIREHITPTLYEEIRATGNTDARQTELVGGQSEDDDDAAGAARRRKWPTVTERHDECTACRRRCRSKAFRLALGNAPAQGFAQQITGK